MAMCSGSVTFHRTNCSHVIFATSTKTCARASGIIRRASIRATASLGFVMNGSPRSTMPVRSAFVAKADRQHRDVVRLRLFHRVLQHGIGDAVGKDEECIAFLDRHARRFITSVEFYAQRYSLASGDRADAFATEAVGIIVTGVAQLEPAARRVDHAE